MITGFDDIYTTLLVQENVHRQEEMNRLHVGTLQSLQTDLHKARESEEEARVAIQQLERAAAKDAEQIGDLQKQACSTHAKPSLSSLCSVQTVLRRCFLCLQVSSAVELHQNATRYCSQLQEYNSKLQDEAQNLSEQLRALQVCTTHHVAYGLARALRMAENAWHENIKVHIYRARK
jgi:peptidoglycan hydrolase CwlO-like protein